MRLVLSAALRTADAVENRKQTVLVHCSDGWDRTGQLCALAQMLLDPHYRTLRGFAEVIIKVGRNICGSLSTMISAQPMGNFAGMDPRRTQV